MENMFAVSESDIVVIVSIVGSSIFFILQWSITSSERIRITFFGDRPTDARKINYVLFIKYTGLIILGVFPALVFYFALPHFSFSDYGLSFSKETNLLSLYWIVLLGVIIIAMNWFAARTTKTHSMYPQIRVQEWDTRLIIIYSVAWCAYLFGYELMFRGFLFFPLVDSIGVWPAISINIALYAISHIPKGLDETVGALLLGVVLCIATLQTGTIWVAFVVHVLLALSNSLFSLLFHPEMKIVKVRQGKVK